MENPALCVESLNVTANVDAAVAANSGLLFVGYAVRESKSVPALLTANIILGAVASTGLIMVPISLLASTYDMQWMGSGAYASDGISIELIAGEADFVLYYRIVA